MYTSRGHNARIFRLFTGWLYVMWSRVMRSSTSPRREASLFNLPVAQGVTGIFLAPRMGAEALPQSSPAVKRQDGNLGVFEHVFGDPAHDQQIAFQFQGLGEQDLPSPPTGRPPLPCLARSGRSPSGPAMAPLE